MKKVLIINGPNLNLLGTREPEIYGKTTLKDIETELKNKAEKLNVEIECFQSNHEGEIVDKICKDTKVEDDNGTVLKENQPVIEKITIEK